MKLNYKRTVLVGLAFFLICAFWQAYDSIIPLILTNKFGMSQMWSGLIMTLDNILALFMLPLFGALSDKCKSPKGRRTPFIVWGTIISVIAFVALSLVDAQQLKNINEISTVDDPAALHVIYERQHDAELQTPDGDKFVLEEKFTEDEFIQITSQVKEDGTPVTDANRAEGKNVSNHDYTNYVTPARQACAHDITKQNPSTLILFIAVLLVVLVAMSTYRSPAVALMPDVTMKPLRSKGNAVINLMGSAGGILVLLLGMVFATGAAKNATMSYVVYFSIIAGVMLLSLLIFRLTINEPKLVKQMQEDSKRYGIEDKEEEDAQTGEKRGLTAGEKRSLIFILGSIFLWFMGYNAVTTKYSVYASNILHKDYNLTLMIAQGAAIIAYLPVGIVSSKIGRKKAILAGVVMLGVAFGSAAFMTSESPTMLMNVMFALAGIAWATINVNSFPMVVEMCSGSDVGKYTGYYYTASMAAQAITPTISGFFMDHMGMTTLFPYATIFVAIAFVTMLFVKHGDSKPEAKLGLEALDVDD